MGLLRLSLVAALGAVAAVLLARHAGVLAAAGVARPDEAVALGTAAAGALVAAWYALSASAAVLATAAELTRRAPRTATALAAAVRRFGAPAVRCVAVAGAGVSLGALPALAVVPEDVVPQDLRPGLVVTQTLPQGAEAPSSTPPTDDGASGPEDEPATPDAQDSAAPAPTSPPAPSPSQQTPVAPQSAARATAAPSATGSPSTHAPAVPDGPEVESYVVRAGDSLWAVAARHLRPGAGAADIAAEWPRWYEANRDVVGADPGLIHPGQRLQAPEPKDLP